MLTLLGFAIDMFIFSKYVGLALLLLGLYWLFKK